MNITELFHKIMESFPKIIHTKKYFSVRSINSFSAKSINLSYQQPSTTDDCIMGNLKKKKKLEKQFNPSGYFVQREDNPSFSVDGHRTAWKIKLWVLWRYIEGLILVLFIKHVTSQNQLRPAKTTQNQPNLVKTTQTSDGFVQLFICSKILENICDWVHFIIKL